mmetsp:Transcript_10459/g.25482  ORF Transcript_10459/g.25482 Transcript_10459/m.25482 type:complete len:248 (+) Transcript_10459:690-1433(+)
MSGFPVRAKSSFSGIESQRSLVESGDQKKTTARRLVSKRLSFDGDVCTASGVDGQSSSISKGPSRMLSCSWSRFLFRVSTAILDPSGDTASAENPSHSISDRFLTPPREEGSARTRSCGWPGVEAASTNTTSPPLLGIQSGARKLPGRPETIFSSSESTEAGSMMETFFLSPTWTRSRESWSFWEKNRGTPSSTCRSRVRKTKLEEFDAPPTSPSASRTWKVSRETALLPLSLYVVSHDSLAESGLQ